MKKLYCLLGCIFIVLIMLGVFVNRTAHAQQNPLAMGTILARTELAGEKGMEAILVLRELPAGGASGKHTQSDTEIVYVLDGSIIIEIQGKPAQTLKTGETFTTKAGDVHNVKNASASAPAKALAFYIAKKGAKLDELSKPTQ